MRLLRVRLLRVRMLPASAHAQLMGGRQDQRTRRKTRRARRESVQLHIGRPDRTAAQLVDPVPGVTAHRAVPRGESRRADHSVDLCARGGGQAAVLLQQRPRVLVGGEVEEHGRQSGGAAAQFTSQPLPRQGRVADGGLSGARQGEVEPAPAAVGGQPAREVEQQRARGGRGRPQSRQYGVRIAGPVQAHGVGGEFAAQQRRGRHHRECGEVRAGGELYRAAAHGGVSGYEEDVPPLLPRSVEVHEQTVLTPRAPW